MMDELQRRWNRLNPDEQNKTLACGAFGLFILGTQAGRQMAMLGGLMYYLSLRKPSDESFEPFLKKWYTEVYFPRFAEAAKQYYEKRAERRDTLGWLADKLRSKWVDASKHVQASVIYEFIVKANPFRMADFWVFKLALVNMGTRRNPCIVRFCGIHNTWFLAPMIAVDFDNTAILDAMNGNDEDKED